jgi:beta-glucosidase
METSLEKQPFIWGIASASYQTEDSPQSSSDPEYFEVEWDLFYQKGKIAQKRAEATHSWSKMDRDIEALELLGVNYYRFGIEWARVEPKPGQYNLAALDKYLEYAIELKNKGITPVVCLWHFNFPGWLTNLENPLQHGWFHPEFEQHWVAYTKLVLDKFKGHVIHWMPQNEPNAYAFVGHLLGMFPPGQRASFKNFNLSMEKAAYFYNLAADIIHETDPDNLCISVQNIIYWQKSVFDFNGFFWKQAQNYNFLHLDLIHKKTDIIGFNYYFKLNAFLIPGARTTNPEGMSYAIKALAERYLKPLWITENGYQEKGDSKRRQYLKDHIGEVLAARDEGLPVDAYFCWCLIDNFEWCMGYKEKFGLFRMNENLSLSPKESAHLYRDIIADNR